MSDSARFELQDEPHRSRFASAYDGNKELREKLGAELRKIRKACGSTLLRFGADSGVHFNRLSKIERGVLLPHDDELTALLRTGAVSPVVESEVLQLARSLREDMVGWNLPDSSLQRSPSSSQDRIRKLLSSASRFRSFSSTTVPGPLQTHEYTLQNFEPYQEVMPQDQAEVERVQAAKSAVRELLYMGDKHFEYVIHESIFLVTPALPETMASQAERIVQLSFLPRVDVRIIPSGTPMRSLARHDFDLGDDEILHIDLAIGGIGIRASHTIRLYAELFSILQSQALSGDKARDYLLEIAAHLRHRARPLPNDAAVVLP